MAWVRVCSLSDIADESAIGIQVVGEPVCLARSRGVVYAIEDVCSHADIALSEGDVADGTVECWLHGSAFDLATGRPTSLPATRPVATFAVKVEGDDVLVDVEQPAE